VRLVHGWFVLDINEFNFMRDVDGLYAGPVRLGSRRRDDGPSMHGLLEWDVFGCDERAVVHTLERVRPG
jgi:hypothetical protein